MTSQMDAVDIGQWRDKKRHLWLMGLIAPTALFVVLPFVWTFNQFGWQTASQVFFWIGPFLLYVLLPVLDLRYGPDGQNPPDEVMERLENDKYYRYCTYVYIPFQYASVIFGAYLFTASDLSWLGYEVVAQLAGEDRSRVVGGGARRHWHQHRARTRPQEGLAGAVAVEDHARADLVRPLLHRAQPRPPRAGRHPGGSGVGTLRRDVLGVLAAQRLGEPALGVAAGGATDAPAGQEPVQLANDVLNAWLMSLAFWGVLIAVFGPALIPFLVIQAIFGFSLLETVNYLEHYGLLRQKTASGRYERCSPEHSWNSDHLVTNLFLYHLQRHSDHHANPTRRYQTLRSIDGAPNLPSGYAIDDRADLLPAAVAKGDGPPGARALRRRHHPGQPASAPAREDPCRAIGWQRERLPLPGLRLRLRRGERRCAGGIPGGYAVDRDTRRLVLPRLRRAREGRLRRDRSEP